MASTGEVMVVLLAVDEDVAGLHLRHAEAGEEQVELAHALQPRDAEDLALVQVEGHVLQLVAGPEAARRENRCAEARTVLGARREGLGDAAADDLLDHVCSPKSR